MLRRLFLDFNAYFTSCEQHLRPELRGKPVVVTPVAVASGCCIAVSYEARRYGVKTGMQVSEARAHCPGLVVVKARPPEYVKLHHALIEVVDSCMYVEKVISIDEMSCPLTGKWQQPEEAVALGQMMQRKIIGKFSPALRCSIGLAPNDYLAKVASEMIKPAGLVRIDEGDLPEILYALELRALPGIGKRMERRLAAHRIFTLKELWGLSLERMRQVWGGVEGERMWFRLRGMEIPLAPTRRGSFSHSRVLPPELRSWEKARAVLLRLLQKAAVRLRRGGYHAGRLDVGVKMYETRWDAFETFDAVSCTALLIAAFQRIWERRPAQGQKPLLVYVVLGDLVESRQLAMSLFHHTEEERLEKLETAMDQLNLAHGSRTVFYAGAWDAMEDGPQRIAFTQIPDLQFE